MVANSNKLILKNTIMLYTRLIIVMLVSLYTVRVVLNALGVVDYGINNVVSSIVTMFSFITMTLSTGIIRYYSYAIGEGNKEKVNQWFNLSVLFFGLVVVAVILISETLGLWFLKNKMVIPEERMNAAFWVFQFSVISFSVHLMIVPFNAMIMAYEKMNIYAYISIVEVCMKLLIAYLITIVSTDKLITYSFLLLLSSLIVSSAYILYCKKKFNKSSKLKFFWNKAYFKELFGFCGWNLIGATSSVFRSQGINLLLNVFFGPIVNAARGIAFQVYHALNNFVSSFYSAFRPQITKRYASGEYDSMMNLVFFSSRVCFFLAWIISLPLLLESPFILDLWLKDVPENTIIFTRLVLINALMESIGYPMSAAVLATGKNALYQILTGGLLIINIPISYLLLKLGYSPESVFVVSICLTFLANISRIAFMKRLLHMRISLYFRKVIWPILKVFVISAIFPCLLFFIVEENILSVISIMAVSIIFVLISVYYMGLFRQERKMVLDFVKQKMRVKR